MTTRAPEWFEKDIAHRGRNYLLHTAIDMTRLRVVVDQMNALEGVDTEVTDRTVQLIGKCLEILRHENDKTRPQ